MADVNLSKAVRSNLLSLQSTAANMAKTQNRLATGLKVNSALDNPSNFFTASSLNSRAGDMANLLDSMSSGIKTIEAADNGLKSITKTVESMQSTLRQARQDKSFKTGSYTIDAATIGTTVTLAEATALVRDLVDNPVKGARVNFTVIDPSAGAGLSQSFAITDDSGRAAVTFYPGAIPTGANRRYRSIRANHPAWIGRRAARGLRFARDHVSTVRRRRKRKDGE